MKAVFAGSFNPFHAGHLHVVLTGARVFEQVFIVLALNPDKPRPSDQDLRHRIGHIYAHLPLELQNGQVQVRFWEGLVVDFCHEHGVEVMLRGLRDFKDLEYERNIESINRQLAADIKTVYVLAPESLAGVSSTQIREAGK